MDSPSKSGGVQNPDRNAQDLVYPRHSRYGLTADCPLNNFGDVTSYYQSPSDNDGLWTNIYLASQSYRYAVTRDPEALRNALESLNAIQFLQDVTGLPGYPARSFAKYGDTGTSYNPSRGQHTWFNSTTFPGWVYLSDTSSDEIAGNEYGLSVFHKYAASSNQERTTSANLVANVTKWIIHNGYYLISPLNERTTWGVWAPEYLNGNASWYDQRGINSLQILSWLVTSANLDPAEASLYEEHFATLFGHHGYGVNMINQKISVPNDENYSDDEIAWLPFATWALATAPSLSHSPSSSLSSSHLLSLSPSHLSSLSYWYAINRSMAFAVTEKSSLWNVIYLSALPDPTADAELYDTLMNDAIWCLQTWPIEQIDWPVRNSQRHDYIPRELIVDNDKIDSFSVFRYDEQSFFRFRTFLAGNQNSPPPPRNPFCRAIQ